MTLFKTTENEYGFVLAFLNKLLDRGLNITGF